VKQSFIVRAYTILRVAAATIILTFLDAGVAFAQGTITGPATPCVGAKAEYSYCRSENFPYIWRWSVSGDASVRDAGTTSTCYKAEVTLRERSTLLTFHQSNPVGVPPVQNVTKQISPKRCAAQMKLKSPIAKIDVDWSNYSPSGNHPA
jgi:hypothetical protein